MDMNDCEEGIDPANPWHASAPDPRRRRVFGYDWGSGLVAPFLPASAETVESALDAAALRPFCDVVADIGSGDGRFVLAAARRGVAEAVGFEMDAGLVAAARAEALSAGLSNARFVQGDFFETLQGPARFSVVVCYLFPAVLSRLRALWFERWLADDASRRLLTIRWPVDDADAAFAARFLRTAAPRKGFFLYQLRR